MKSKITCSECKYGIDVNSNGKVKLCDNPNLKTYGKNVKHGQKFNCGYGVMWNAGETK
jgi:hypothetical protein